MVTVVPLSQNTLQDVNRANQPFEVVGRVVPVFQNGVWSWGEELFEAPFFKRYEDDSQAFFAAHLNCPDKGAYLAYAGGGCVGQLVLRADWNGYAFIEGICVAQSARRQGVGRLLLQTAEAWARDRGLAGLALETQDNNLLACRFYQRMGFQLGGVNTMLYKNWPACDETALFWYLLFS